MTTKEQSRIQVLNGVMEGKVTVAQASGLMGVSQRHGWRLLAAYREEGAAAIAHGNRGRKPMTTTYPRTQQKVMELAEGPYAGLNHTHLTEMLAERGGYPPLPLYREAGPAGRRTAESTSQQSLQALQPTGTLSTGGDAAADRWEPPRLASGPRPIPDPGRRCGRRHGDGPLRPCSGSRKMPTATC